MNKQEFIAQLAKKGRLPKKEAKAALDSALSLITASLKKGD